jgi:tRNA-uridine 2-sulfurtransferase
MNILVGMSGGVDSSVAAALLVEQGHDVVGVTLKLWGGESDTGCCSVSDVDDARRVAQQIGIDHLVFNFTEEFDRHVVAPYVHAHAEGLTPNPCIECNRHLKFDRLLERADLLGFDAVATGHHARIERDAGGSLRIARGHDVAKDQSYVVHMLDQHQLARTVFPVGDRTKDTVRADAARLGLRTASKPDSQDVCFITSVGGRSTFLGDRIPMRPAKVVDVTGATVGHVDAVELVTIGQRKGLGTPGGGDALYAIDVDRAAGVVRVGSAQDLLRPSVEIGQLVWSNQSVLGDVRVQWSAHGATKLGSLDAAGTLSWTEPQRRIAPGQSVVLYDPTDRHVLGGGIAR